jgi:hypothetical protein
MKNIIHAFSIRWLASRTQSRVFVFFEHSFFDDLGVYNGNLGRGELKLQYDTLDCVTTLVHSRSAELFSAEGSDEGFITTYVYFIREPR